MLSSFLSFKDVLNVKFLEVLREGHYTIFMRRDILGCLIMLVASKLEMFWDYSYINKHHRIIIIIIIIIINTQQQTRHYNP